MPYHIPSWRKLTTLGGWLFSFEQPEPIQILCGRKKITHTTIVGTGILEIHPECFAKTRYHTLLGSKTYLSKDSYYYIPNMLLNISLISPKIYQYPKGKHTTVNLFPNDINKLERTSDSLYEIEAQQSLNYNRIDDLLFLESTKDLMQNTVPEETGLETRNRGSFSQSTCSNTVARIVYFGQQTTVAYSEGNDKLIQICIITNPDSPRTMGIPLSEIVVSYDSSNALFVP